MKGCTKCEELQCDGTVGFGGSPDETGETTLDAMVMDGVTMAVGAVSDLRRIKNAVGVAKAVMEYTKHTMIAGEAATSFAKSIGFKEEDISTPVSRQMHQDWIKNACQPNYWRQVLPDPTKSCGPYHPNKTDYTFGYARVRSAGNLEILQRPNGIGKNNHDTVAVLALDSDGFIASATSTNGASHKIPGRVGDSPVMGAGSYADNDAGGCGATGDGGVMMRFLPCYQAVEFMRQGMTPTDAAEAAMSRIIAKYPVFKGAIITLNKAGQYGAASWGWTFTYSVRTVGMARAAVVSVPPFKPYLEDKMY